MTTLYEQCVNFVLSQEGGYVNDPNDPGGETNFGISKRSYPTLDIKNLTADVARGLYYKDYWLPNGCDKRSPEMALVTFDTAVNMGPGALPQLLAGNPSLEEFCSRRILKYSGFKNFGLYGKTWVRRVLASYKAALSLSGALSTG